MTPLRFILLLALVGFAAAVWQSCKHHPLLPDPLEPGDTSINPIDTTTNPVDTSGTGIDSTGQPCDPNKTYFVNDIIPFVNTYCSMPGQNPGCHLPGQIDNDNVFTGATPYQMYLNILNEGDVDAGDPGSSKFYEFLVEPMSDDDHMPPPGYPQPTAAEIQMIYQWIADGAKFDSCNANFGQQIGCDTTNMTFAKVDGIMNKYSCKGCHNNSVASDNINLSTYQGVKNAQLDNGRLRGAINHLSGYTPMPYPFPTKPKMGACDLAKFNAWINAGMPQ
jgi:hypothetical protein